MTETLVAQGPEGLARLNAFLQHRGAPVPDDLAPGVKAFLAAPVVYPPWVDLTQIQRADQLFYRYGLETMLVLFLRSFSQFFANENGGRTFYIADVFAAGSVKRFVIEIAQLIFDLVTPGSLEAAPDKGEGVLALQKLRLHHSVVRSWLLNHSRATPWDAAWGVPINQDDLAFSIVAFSLWNLDGFEKLGMTLTREEQEATFHFWKVVGYLLGLDASLQPPDMARGRVALAEQSARLLRPSLVGTTLVRQLIGAIQSFLPVFLRGLPITLMRFLMDPAMVVLLRVPRGLGAAWLSTWVLRVFLGQVRAMDWVIGWVARFFLQGLRHGQGRQGTRGEFRVPVEMTGRGMRQ